RICGHVVWLRTWSTPFHHGGLVPLQYAHASIPVPPRMCENGIPAASRTPRTSCFLLFTMCGIHTSEPLVPFPHPLRSASAAERGVAMTFEEILDQAIAMLQRRGRVTYRTLRLQFQLDEEQLEALKDELLFAHPQVHDETERGLVWSDDPGTAPPASAPA